MIVASCQTFQVLPFGNGKWRLNLQEEVLVRQAQIFLKGVYVTRNEIDPRWNSNAPYNEILFTLLLIVAEMK